MCTSRFFVLLSCVGLILSACSSSDGSGGTKQIGTNGDDSTDSNRCAAVQANLESPNKSCSSSSDCPGFSCPCADGSTVSSKSCWNGTCRGAEACEDACGASNYNCDETNTGEDDSDNGTNDDENDQSDDNEDDNQDDDTEQNCTCDGKSCGQNACGESCGTCESGFVCQANNCACEIEYKFDISNIQVSALAQFDPNAEVSWTLSHDGAAVGGIRTNHLGSCEASGGAGSGGQSCEGDGDVTFLRGDGCGGTGQLTVRAIYQDDDSFSTVQCERTFDLENEGTITVPMPRAVDAENCQVPSL